MITHASGPTCRRRVIYRPYGRRDHQHVSSVTHRENQGGILNRGLIPEVLLVFFWCVNTIDDNGHASSVCMPLRCNAGKQRSGAPTNPGLAHCRPALSTSQTSRDGIQVAVLFRYTYHMHGYLRRVPVLAMPGIAANLIEASDYTHGCRVTSPLWKICLSTPGP
jgi:hypothetical protein